MRLNNKIKLPLLSALTIGAYSLLTIFYNNWSRKHDPEYIMQQEVIKEAERRKKALEDELKDDPTLEDIKANPRYDQEWETSRVWDETFHFSIDHPKSWGIINEGRLAWVRRPCREVCPTFYIDAIKRTEGIDNPNQHPDLRVILDPENNYTILKEEYTDIGGYNAYTILVEHPSIREIDSPVYQKFYYILTTDLIYKVDYYENNNISDVYLREEDWVFGDIFQRMVQSMRFDKN